MEPNPFHGQRCCRGPIAWTCLQTPRGAHGKSSRAVTQQHSELAATKNTSRCRQCGEPVDVTSVLMQGCLGKQARFRVLNFFSSPICLYNCFLLGAESSRFLPTPSGFRLPSHGRRIGTKSRMETLIPFQAAFSMF